MINKWKTFTPVVLLLFLLTACGSQEVDQSMETGREEASKNSESESAGDLQDGEKDTEENRYEISDTKATIYYEGEAFMKSVVSTGGDKIYICGIKQDGNYFVGCMNKEENILRELPVEMPEHMRILNMTVDRQERCHILWVSVEEVKINQETMESMTFKDSYITIINQEGELQKTIDFSEIFAKAHTRPYCFVTDEEGNYYLDNRDEILKCGPDGSLQASFACPGFVEGIGCGRSGGVYCTYADENGGERLGRVEQDAILPCADALPRVDAIYGSIAEGTDTELLIYNKLGGVYTYDAQSDTTDERIAPAQLPISGTDVSGYGFLGDGRLCLISQTDGNTVFYYIPAGR